MPFSLSQLDSYLRRREPVATGGVIDNDAIARRCLASGASLGRAAAVYSDWTGTTYVESLNVLSERRYARPEGATTLRDEVLGEGLEPIFFTRVELAARAEVETRTNSWPLATQLARENGCSFEVAEQAIIAAERARAASPAPVDRSQQGAARRRAAHSRRLFSEGASYFDDERQGRFDMSRPALPALRVGVPYVAVPRGSR
jgi:hypothetical protein